MIREEPHRPGTTLHLLEEPSVRTEALHYATAAALVLLVGYAGASVASRARVEPSAASEVDTAIMIDLPPELASSEPKREVSDGPEQQASAAATASDAPPPVDAPKPTEAPEPPDPAPALDLPPPPSAPNPAAVLEEKKPEAPPSQIAAESPAPQQEAQAPAGANQPVKANDAAGEDARPHASARAMSLWQRSMVSRLETSKRTLHRRIGRDGTVVIAFAIDHGGRLVSMKVARGSGDPELDALARRLVKRATPFPAPPAGAGERALSFIVPIRFSQ